MSGPLQPATVEVNAKPLLEAGLLSPTTTLFKRRWFILAMFIILSMSNAFQWMEYAIIADIVQHFYGVTGDAVNWTSMIYMIAYIPFIFPAAWILDKYGLRVVALLGALGNAIGAWIKCGSAAPNLFPLTFFGQAIVGTSQIFILGLPTRLAAVWFGPNEVSTACAMGVFGNQLGIAFGFLVPPMLVPATGNGTGVNVTVAETGFGLRNLFLMSAGVNTVILLAIFLFFKARPPSAPSPAQLAAIEATVDHHFFESLKQLLLNRNFMLLIVTYGMNVGVFYAVSTLLNQLLEPMYPGKGVQIGQIGLLIVLAGMAGSILAGVWLDKTKRFKQTTFLVYVSSFAFMLVFAFTIDLQKLWVVFVVAGLLGFFMTGYLPIGFEFGVEITYPISEGTVSGLLNVSCQVFGLLETLIMAEIHKRFGVLASNLACAAVLLVGCGLTLFIKPDLRRQGAHQESVGKTEKAQNGFTKEEDGTPLVVDLENYTALENENFGCHHRHHEKENGAVADDTRHQQQERKNCQQERKRLTWDPEIVKNPSNNKATTFEDNPPPTEEDSQPLVVDSTIVDGHLVLADNIRIKIEPGTTVTV